MIAAVESRQTYPVNDCLESTPPILNDLTNILVRFRTHRYAATTDIEKAFLHIGLDENDRDATRFLWSSDVQNPDSPLITYRFKSVLFGATCSPFILSATILKHLENNKHAPAARSSSGTYTSTMYFLVSRTRLTFSSTLKNQES